MTTAATDIPSLVQEIRQRIAPNAVGGITATVLRGVLLDILNVVSADLAADAVGGGIALNGFLTANVRQAARPVVEAYGGSLPAFFDGYVSGVAGVSSAYWALPFAPIGGLLYGALAAYLAAPQSGAHPGLGMAPPDASAALALIYATASGYGDQSPFNAIAIGVAPAGPPGPPGAPGAPGAPGQPGLAGVVGPVATLVCAEPVVSGLPVFVDRVSGQLRAARADTYADTIILGLAAAAAAVGATVDVLLGRVPLADWSAATGAHDLPPGALLYLAPTGGLTAQAPVGQPGVAIVTVGRAADARTLIVAPSTPTRQ